MSDELEEWFSRIEKGDVDYVQKHKGEYKYSRDHNNFTGLMNACSFVSDNHLRIIDLLIEEQGKTGQQGITALMLAAIVGNVSAVPKLNKEQGMQDENGFTAFVWSYIAKQVDVQRKLKQLYHSKECIMQQQDLKKIVVQESVKKTVQYLQQRCKQFQETNRQTPNVDKQAQVRSILQPLYKQIYFDDFGMQGMEFTLNDVAIADDIAQMDSELYQQFLQVQEFVQNCISLYQTDINIANEKLQINQTIYNVLKKKYGEIIQLFVKSI